jgi:hypothetical protein
MANNPFISNFSANLEALALNVASAFGGATLTIYSGTQPANANTALAGNTALATFTLPASGSNSVSAAGVITFGAISNVTASASNTATFFRVTNGANTICDGSVGTSSADLIINSTAISSGATVSITSFTYTITQ